MSPATYFVQECPTCGRTLEVRVEYLGKRVACRHCRGSFIAEGIEPSTDAAQALALMQRADELLALAESRRHDAASWSTSSPMPIAS